MLVKAMLPYLPAGSSVSAAYLIKIMELQNIRRYYQSAKPPELGAMSAPALSMPEILQNLIRFFPSEKRETLEQLQNAMEMMQMFETMQEMQGGEFFYGESEQQTDESARMDE